MFKKNYTAASKFENYGDYSLRAFLETPQKTPR